MARRVQKAVIWLPVDSRLFGSLLSFGHVHGVARIFLQLEILLSTLVVVGTIIVTCLHLATLVHY